MMNAAVLFDAMEPGQQDMPRDQFIRNAAKKMGGVRCVFQQRLKRQTAI